jgi:hypothetical protein
MTRDGGLGRQQDISSGAHRRPRKRSAMSRAVAAGGAVICIGAVYEVTAPTVQALTIVFRSTGGTGQTNEVRVNILHGNVFDPQLGLLGANVSNNSTSSNGTFSTVGNPLVDNLLFNNPFTKLIDAFWNRELVFGPAASGPVNNVTQISFGSFNIFNPQASIFGGNLSNNTTNTNMAMGYGNNSSASVTSMPNMWSSWFGGMTGNGNALQLAFMSGNIVNPQWSLFGPNVSNNTALTNVADYNGNYSQASAMQGGGLLGALARLFGGGFLGGMTGNGNTTQAAVGTSNITNPQISIGGSNQSNNTAVTNEAVGNGNSSQTTVDGSGNVISIGTTGNGNTNQTAVGASNIENTQVSIGDIGLSPRPADLTASQSGSQLATTSTAPTSSSGSNPACTSSNPACVGNPASTDTVSSANANAAQLRSAVDRALGLGRPKPPGTSPSATGTAGSPAPQTGNSTSDPGNGPGDSGGSGGSGGGSE